MLFDRQEMEEMLRGMLLTLMIALIFVFSCAHEQDDSVMLATPNLLFAEVTPDGVVLTCVASQEDNVIGYFVYRRSQSSGWYLRLNDEPVSQSDNPSYTDTSAESGITYSYAVSAIDRSGNESEKSTPLEIIAEGPQQIETPVNLTSDFLPTDNDIENWIGVGGHKEAATVGELYILIGDDAHVFMQNGCRLTVSRRYSDGETPVEIRVYDMETRQNAIDVYRALDRSDSVATWSETGAEGRIITKPDQYIIEFRQGNLFVQILSAGKSTAETFALLMSGRINLAQRGELPKEPEPDGIPKDVFWIDSDPQGANIYIDGIDTGFVTPHGFENPQGKHHVKLRLGDECIGADNVINISDRGSYTAILGVIPAKFENFRQEPADVTAKTKGDIYISVRVVRDCPAGIGNNIPQIDYYYEGRSEYDGYEDMVSKGDSVWSFTIPEPAGSWASMAPLDVAYKILVEYPGMVDPLKKEWIQEVDP